MTASPGHTVAVLTIRVEGEVFPPYHPFHGTNLPMQWRRVLIETSRGKATFEQTDYGHPGRFNPWEPRGIDSPLVSKVRELEALAAAAAEAAA